MTDRQEDIRKTMRSNGICVVIPTYNNAGTLQRVVNDVLGYCCDVIVVNDGSTDSTPAILSQFGNAIGVVTHDVNLGKGAALKSGFVYAKERGFDYAVTLDSDGQHYADDLPLFVKAIIEHPNSLIVGQRDLNNVDINGKSAFANKFSNFWFTVQTGRALADTQTGFRAYPLQRLHGLRLMTSRYEAELELLVFAAWNGVAIVAIPINVYYPPRNERVSHFRPAADFTRITLLNTCLCFGAILYGLPVRFCHTLANRRLFNKEFTPFTRRGGQLRPYAITLERIFMTAYTVLHFLFWSQVVFRICLLTTPSGSKSSEKSRLRPHQLLNWCARFFARNYPGGRLTIDNSVGEAFDAPALIICNHTSIYDLPNILALDPRIVFVTNEWVWNCRPLKVIVRNAEFVPVFAGVESIMPKLKSLKDRGYSIMVFPEGTRSPDGSVARFHQGAFAIAAELHLDILPVAIHGAGHYLPKSEALLLKNRQQLKIMNRVAYGAMNDVPFRKQASYFRRLIMDQHSQLAAQHETPTYFSYIVLCKYAYRGWSVVARCKRILRGLIANHINLTMDRDVYFVNGGIGVIPLMCALLSKNVDVYSFESNLSEYNVAAATPDIPRNLHLRHSIWRTDYLIPADATVVVIDSRPMLQQFEQYSPMLITTGL